jgi:Flp pilus assembly protein TadD
MAPPSGRQSLLLDTAAALAVAAATLLLLWRLTGGGFVHDDDRYVTDARPVQAGLTAAGVRWAFTTTAAEFWHPVTWLSLMLDRQLFGPGPFGFHRSALLLHAVNAVLLFVAARVLVGSRATGVLAALLFAVHPLHVETAAWIADRKDLLAGLFCLLCLIGYRRYAARPGPLRYALALAAFALGLLAKPSLVSLPAALLLLDWWPLGRLRSGPGGTGTRRLLAEKVPFALAALAAAGVGYWAQARVGNVHGLADLPLDARVANALTAAVAYLRMTALPAGLAVYYPHPLGSIPAAHALAALGLLAGVTALLVRRRRAAPHLLAGWLWFGTMLLPVSGLVQVGDHAMADRYTYVPHTVLFLALAWGASRLATRRPEATAAVLVACVAACAALSAAAWRQAGFWKDAETLYRRSLAVTRDNRWVRQNLGTALVNAGRYREGEEQFRALLRLDPGSGDGEMRLAFSLAHQGAYAEAERHARRAAALAPRDARVWNVLGTVVAAEGRYDEAVAYCGRAIALDPGFVDAYLSLGEILGDQGRRAEGVYFLDEALRRDPGNERALASRAGLTAR